MRSTLPLRSIVKRSPPKANAARAPSRVHDGDSMANLSRSSVLRSAGTGMASSQATTCSFPDGTSLMTKAARASPFARVTSFTSATPLPSPTQVASGTGLRMGFFPKIRSRVSGSAATAEPATTRQAAMRTRRRPNMCFSLSLSLQTKYGGGQFITAGAKAAHERVATDRALFGAERSEAQRDGRSQALRVRSYDERLIASQASEIGPSRLNGARFRSIIPPGV